MATADAASSTNRVARVFGLSGESWLRHSNPWSVWTRFAVLPMLALSIWSRDWIGLLCLIPLALSLVWLFVNPLFFAPPRSTRNWASKGVLGERIWSERKRAELPPQFDSRAPAIAQLIQVVGLVPMSYGLIDLDAIATVTGVIIVQVSKLWYIDRMVLLFDELKADPRYAAWDF
jgi:Family of unknown function (DUF6653)